MSGVISTEQIVLQLRRCALAEFTLVAAKFFEREKAGIHVLPHLFHFTVGAFGVFAISE